ncbi:MAG: hypothetical protein P1U86_08255 [Verrucomicrobiales bacterium]|nr:hypothetical protein [Verrucomicrobiales bacterium]
MKSILKLALMTVFALALVSCNEEKSSGHDHSDHSHDHTSSGTAQVDGDYPLTTCVVSGEALGSMGTPIEVTHEGTTVKLCCKSCIKEFKASPEKFVAKLDSAQ